MLASLLNIPHQQQDWDFFSWNHRLSHAAIRSAIQQKYGVVLTDYIIDPMNSENMSQFLQNNAALHSDMNSVLGLPGIDLLDVNMSDERQVNAWIYYHWQEHFAAETAAGVGS